MKKYLFLLLFVAQQLFSTGLGLDPKLGATVPLDLTFIDENGKEVTLKKLMDGKPTLLTLNYFKCAGVCSPQLTELARTLSQVHLAENADYKVITVDFAETETADLAKRKRKSILQSMTRFYVIDAWHFVIGENNSSGKLADAVGFKYKAVKTKSGDTGYLHGAIAVLLSPEGKITRYLQGVNQLSADITLALKEAKEGKVGELIPKEAPFCFTKNQEADTFVNNITRIAGVLSIILFLSFYFFYLRKKSKAKKEEV